MLTSEHVPLDSKTYEALHIRRLYLSYIEVSRVRLRAGEPGVQVIAYDDVGGHYDIRAYTIIEAVDNLIATYDSAYGYQSEKRTQTHA
jgi:hypothetical protein